MKGFFSNKQTQSNSRPDGKVYSCVSCGLYKSCKSAKMKPYGNFQKKIMNIGEHPSKIDDRKNKQGQDKAGKYLESSYEELDIDLFEDCINVNAINCYPGETSKNLTYQITCCRKNLLKIIKEYKPKIIMVYGSLALEALIGHRWQKGINNIDKWRGYTIPDQELQCWVIPMYSPQQIIDGDKEIETIWKQDLQAGLDLLEKPFAVYKEPNIQIIKDLTVLNEIKENTNAAFDYETTGIKPHAKGHRIICASIAYTENDCYVFMMPKSKKARQPFIDFLKNKKIGKIAQNMKYEHVWSLVRLHTIVMNWVWDTMIATHILDNREGVTGLKFQTYVQFGVIDYASEVTPYFRSKDEKNGNAINQIHKLIETENGKQILLKYCGLDSIYEKRLAEKQMQTNINKDAYNLFHEGVLAFCRAEEQGLRVDLDYAEKKKEVLNKKINKLELRFRQSNFYKRWEHVMGNKTNMYSPQQLASYLYKVKKIKPANTTKSGQGSTDEESLSQLKIPELNDLLKIKKLKKINETYLGSFLREQVDGYLHPNFNLHFTKTFRSSSDRPNFQNIPKRDKQAKFITRKSLHPRPGHQLLEVDYSGIEVRIAACYHKDPVMLKYIKDPSSDMHGDMAKQLFILDEFDKSKPEHYKLRQAAKNGFVFPQFYGSYYKSNAIYLACEWGELPDGKWKSGQGISLNGGTLGDHLINKGIKSLNGYVEHVKEIEYDFWNNRFRTYEKWKQKQWRSYQKRGYVELFTGFKCRGLMKRNETINYPVQGAAFHCLLWSFIRLDQIMREENWKTKLIGQIHDAIIFDVHPDELQYISKVIRKVTCEELPKTWKWINVPLDVEADLGKIDASWAELESYKL